MINVVLKIPSLLTTVFLRHVFNMFVYCMTSTKHGRLIDPVYYACAHYDYVCAHYHDVCAQNSLRLRAGKYYVCAQPLQVELQVNTSKYLLFIILQI